MSCTGNKLPLTYDLHVYRGDSFVRIFKLRNLNNDGTPGEPYDLTGCTILSQVREYVDGPLLATAVATVDPDQIANKGCINFELDSNLSNYDGVIGIWDLQVTWPEGIKVTYLAGDVHNKVDVSYE